MSPRAGARLLARALLRLPRALWAGLVALRRTTLAMLVVGSVLLSALSLAATVASFTSGAFVTAVSAVAARAGLSTVQARREARQARIARRVAARSARGVARSVTGTVAQSVPIVGAAAVAGLTAWEIADACKTIADMRALDPDVGDDDLCADALARAAALAAAAGVDPQPPDATTDLTAPPRGASPAGGGTGAKHDGAG